MHLWQMCIRDRAEVVSELPDDERFFIDKMVIEGLAILARSLDDVGNRYLLKGHFVTEFYECIRDKKFRIKRAHTSFPFTRLFLCESL